MLDLVALLRKLRLIQAEPRRSQYLDTIGITEFLPRRPVPGAKASLRTIQRSADTSPIPLAPRAPVRVQGDPVSAPPARAPIDIVEQRVEQRVEPKAEQKAEQKADQTAERYVLLLVRTGNVVWLEDLAETNDHRLQEQLIWALARALGVAGDTKVAPSLIEWPLQAASRLLDQGTIADFVGSRLAREADGGSLQLVAMGERIASWCTDLEGYKVFKTVTASQMLAEPLLKRDVWLDLHGELNSELL